MQWLKEVIILRIIIINVPQKNVSFSFYKQNVSVKFVYHFCASTFMFVSYSLFECKSLAIQFWQLNLL